MAQAFKESIGAGEFGRWVAEGVTRAGLEPEVVVASDGGDGLLEALAPEVMRWSDHQVSDPLQRPVTVRAAWLDGKSAVVETRLVCGLSLLAPEERDPLRTTTRGVGELLDQVVRDGAESVIVGLGGSATVDGGVGMARAWGWVPYDESGVPLPEGGGALERVSRISRGSSPRAQVTALCDVRNPLLGHSGAARVFAPQKGASPADVETIERGLEKLISVTEAEGARALAARPGAGAAGGLGFAVSFFARGELVEGAPWVLDRVGLEDRLEGAALVIIGEGAFDRTSLEGKLCGDVIRRAERAGLPVLLLAPRAEGVPRGVAVETGGGWWTPQDLARHAERGVDRALRLLGD